MRTAKNEIIEPKFKGIFQAAFLYCFFKARSKIQAFNDRSGSKHIVLDHRRGVVDDI